MASVATDEDVVNIALSHIGAKSITTLATDTIVEAVEARRIYFNIRDRLMRSHPWNFITLRVELTDSGTDPVFGWDKGFLLPSDLLRIISVHATNSNPDQPRYRLEKQSISSALTDVLLINSSTCFIRYVYLETDPSKWAADFIDAFAWQLAAELALVLPVSGATYDRLSARAERTLLYAKSVDGFEDYPEQIPEGSWITDRSTSDDGNR